MKRMKQLLVLIVFCISMQSFAQDLENPSLLIPASPEVQQFQNYGNIPLKTSRGLPIIDIPVYMFELDGLKIPVSISYDASGIRVDDIAAPVGLKWSLNVGGIVGRNINGLPDEGNNGWFNRTEEQLLSCVPDLLDQCIAGTLDICPDQYFYSIAGHSGNFSFKRDKTVFTSFLNELKIEGFDDSTDEQFKITDAQGNQYYFDGGLESTHISTHREYTGGSTTTGNGVTAWKLSKIVTNSGNEINFTYTSYSYSLPNIYSHSDYGVNVQDAPESLYGLHYSTKQIIHTISCISTIETATEKISFTYATDSNLEIMQKKLTQIQIKDLINDKVKKIYKLVHDSYSGNARLRLRKLEMYDGDNSFVSGYEFNYDNNSLPAYGSCARDIFGYYNTNSQTHMIPVDSEHLSLFPYTPANREVNETRVKYGALSEIVYPTGGKTKFYFEANKETINNKNYYAAGLRLSKQEDYDELNNKCLEKQYVYSGMVGYGNSVHIANDYSKYFNDYATIMPQPQYKIKRFKSIPFEETFSALYGKAGGFNYSSVRTNYIENGSIAYYHIDSYSGCFDFFTLTARLTEKTYYKSDNTLVKKERYVHNNANIESFAGYVSAQKYKIESYYVCDGIFYADSYQPLSATHYQTNEPLLFYKRYDLKTSDQITEYFNNDSIVTKTEYAYNTNALPSKIESYVLKGGSEKQNNITKIRYASDYTYTGNNIPALKANHIIGKPLDIRKLKVVSSVEKVVSGKIAKYNTNGQLTNEYHFENTLPQTDNWSASGHISSGFNLNTTYSYDATSKKLTQANKPEQTIAVIWGYENTRIVAEIANATYSQAMAQLNTTDKNKIKAGQCGDYQMRAILDKIRDGLSNAMVKTYTYDPVYGITSMTDASGLVTYYEYDKFGRLVYVKDHNKNILKKTEYNYAQ